MFCIKFLLLIKKLDIVLKILMNMVEFSGASLWCFVARFCVNCYIFRVNQINANK